MSKKAITIRVDAALLASVRERAADENRTLTNYIETVLKQAAAPKPIGVPVEIGRADMPAIAEVPVLLSADVPAAAVLDAVEPVGEA